MSTNINIRVDSEIKSQAQEVFASLGLDMSTAINIFLRQAIRQRGLPFAVTSEPVRKQAKPGAMSDDFDAPLENEKAQKNGSAFGRLKKYANPALAQHEKGAWKQAMVEKYANR